ncbi:MAG: sialate O-acetylesterase [Bacteroides sp.]|nr:sialate O-acetylesterase [Bacteroides sp.]
MKSKILALILLCCATSLAAKVKLPSLIGDNMVLQQQTEVRLWGTATPKAEIRVTPSWSGQPTVCRADKEGNWQLALLTPEAGYTPYEITFDDGEKTTLKNVLVGEVWLAAGQSNMQMPLKGFGGCCVQNGIETAISAATAAPGVRMFNVPMRQSYTPQETCGGQWMTTRTFTDVMEFSATAFYFASLLSNALHIPVGIVNCSYGGTRVESWLPREILQDYQDIPTDSVAISRLMPDYKRPMLTYNGMFRAVRRCTVKGIIWYQGCSNVDSHSTYADRLATMVKHWREELSLGDIPFYFVEIAPYDYESGDQADGARLREAQFRAQSLIPNSGMVSTNDLAEPFERYNIHPRRKQPVGNRLAYMALNRTYGKKQVCCEGPQYKSWTAKDNEAWVSFDHLDMGICRNYDIRGFEVAGEDRVFHPADKVWLHWQTNEMVVSSEKVPHPVAVRYCFRDFQVGTMIGGNELPTVPFRTDDW